MLTDLDTVNLGAPPVASQDAAGPDAPIAPAAEAGTDARADSQVVDAALDAGIDAAPITLLAYDFVMDGLPGPDAGFACKTYPNQTADWIAGEGVRVDVSQAPTDPTFACELPEVKASASYAEVEFRYDPQGSGTNGAVGFNADARVFSTVLPVVADAGRIDLRSSMRFNAESGSGDLVIFDFKGEHGVGTAIDAVGSSIITLRQELRTDGAATIATVLRESGPVTTTRPMLPLVGGIDLAGGVRQRLGVANFGGPRRVYLRKISVVITQP